MVKQFLRIFSLFWLFTLTSYAAPGDSRGIGQVARNLLEPVGLMSDMVQTGCFVLGACFLFAAIVKYFEHKRSPLMVPISTVVFLTIAGIILVALPFLSLVVDTAVPYSLMKK